MRNFVFTLLSSILIAASAGAQQSQTYRSLYTDIKAHEPGDVVTILIAESTTGARKSNVNSSSESAINASGSISGNLTSVLPMLGANSEFEDAYTGNEGTSQQDLLTGKVTAVVTEVTPGGNLKLQGKRRLEVNGETHILTLSGLVRPKDVSSENTVFSYNLADVEIAYKKAGLLNKLGKPGWVTRWANWMLVIGLGAAAYLGVSAAAN